MNVPVDYPLGSPGFPDVDLVIDHLGGATTDVPLGSDHLGGAVPDVDLGVDPNLPPPPYVQFRAVNFLNPGSPDSGFPFTIFLRPAIDDADTFETLFIQVQLVSAVTKSGVTLFPNDTGEDIFAPMTVLASSTAVEGEDYAWDVGSLPAPRFGVGKSTTSFGIRILRRAGWVGERILDLELAVPVNSADTRVGSRGWNWRFRILIIPHTDDKAPVVTWELEGTQGPATITEGGGTKIFALRARKSGDGTPGNTQVVGEDTEIKVRYGGTAWASGAGYGVFFTSDPAPDPNDGDRVTLTILKGQHTVPLRITPVDGGLDSDKVLQINTALTVQDEQTPRNLAPLAGNILNELIRFEDSAGDDGYPFDAITPPSYAAFLGIYSAGANIDAAGGMSANVYGCNDAINSFAGDTGQLHYESHPSVVHPLDPTRAGDWLEVSHEAIQWALDNGTGFAHSCIRWTFSSIFSGYTQPDQDGIVQADGKVLSGGQGEASPAQVLYPSADGDNWFSAFLRPHVDPAKNSDAFELVIYERFGTPLPLWNNGQTYPVGRRVKNSTPGTKNYRCIQAHVASNINEPGSGANWTTFWELGQGTGAGGFTGPRRHVSAWRWDPVDPFNNPPIHVGEDALSGDWIGGFGFKKWTLVNGWWRFWVWLRAADIPGTHDQHSDPPYSAGNYLNLFVKPTSALAGDVANQQGGKGIYVAARQYERLPAGSTEPTTYQDRPNLVYQPKGGVCVDDVNGWHSIPVQIVNDALLAGSGDDQTLPFVAPSQIINVPVGLLDSTGAPIVATNDTEISMRLSVQGTTEYTGGAVLPPWLDGAIPASVRVVAGTSSTLVPVTIDYSPAIRRALENPTFARIEIALAPVGVVQQGVDAQPGSIAYTLTVPENSSFELALDEGDGAPVGPAL